jgi:hypothetical protein
MGPLLATGSAAKGTIQHGLFARIVAESAMQPGGSSLNEAFAVAIVNAVGLRVRQV